MVKPNRRSLLAAGLVLVMAWALLRLRGQAPAPASPGGAASGPRAAAGGEALPRIGLDRLSSPPAEVAVGERDIFAFDDRGPVRGGPGGIPGPPVVVMTPPPPPTDPVAPANVQQLPVAPPVAKINLRYVGIVESQRGLRVAFFLTERNEILTGRAGDVVANRYKVVKIGLESVDMQELGSERPTRIPFVKLK
jgi:hypothetical protein